MDLVHEKITQTQKILSELGLDAWAVFVAETLMQSDPMVPLVVGHDVTWQSLFLYTASGEAIALVGKFDEDNFRRQAGFTEVITYVEGAGKAVRDLLARVNPKTIALDYSRDNAAADGLRHGMFLLLNDYLAGTPYVDRLISAEDLIRRLVGRKTAGEMKRLTAAAMLAHKAWENALPKIKAGQSEIEIAAIIDEEIASLGAVPSFPTIVNAGGKTDPGHGGPTEAKVEPGDLLHVDFGARWEGYCSDLQRLIYFKKPSEKTPPAELVRAFNTVRDIITASASRTIPGAIGHEVDAAAREDLRRNGYDVYQHALGHQLGRSVHDGGALIGPRWERYGRTPTYPLEAGNVFTLELEIMLLGIGCVGLEEDVVIESTGPARFLCQRQMELTVK